MTHTKISISARIILQYLLVLVLVPFLPLLITGRWGWWEAWAYALLFIVSLGISRLLAARRSPDLLAERARYLQHQDAKSWDRRLVPLLGLGIGLVPLVAGLDVRFGWSQAFGIVAKGAALLFIVLGYGLSSYALIENRFFSGMVRIQTDRGHRLVSSGPYRWIRHPGYAGALMTYLATPVLLDARWATLPVIAISILLLIRTRLEDRTLQEELAGYREYAGRVRYRLIPGVW